MIELPKRSYYKEIEAFEDYEFTNCIAYEMAIRNKKVIKIIKLLNRIAKFKSRKMENKVLIKGIHVEELGIKYPCIFQFDEITEDLQNKLKVTYFFDYTYYELTEELINPLGKHFLIHDDFIEELMQEREMSIKGDNSYIKPIYDTKVKEGYVIKQKLKSDLTVSGTEFKTSIETNFKKQLYLPIGVDNSISININPNLPKDELIAYITKIKDDFNKDNSIVKTPLELLGNDLEKSDNKHTQKKPNAEKYADWFYIYDCYQILKANDKKKSNETIYNEIDLSLLDYYDSVNDDYYSIETYKKTIMKNMNYLIDELGYKELIAGVKTNKP